MLGKVGKVGKSPQSLRSMSETPTVRDAPCPLFYQPPNNVCHFAHFAHFDFPQGEGVTSLSQKYLVGRMSL